MSEYKITVKPGSSQEKILATSENELTIYLRAKPHDGEANAALVNAIAKHFKIPKTSITILRGAHSHTKIIHF